MANAKRPVNKIIIKVSITWYLKLKTNYLIQPRPLNALLKLQTKFFFSQGHKSESKKKQTNKVLSLKSMDWENEAHKIFNNQGPIKGEDSN